MRNTMTLAWMYGQIGAEQTVRFTKWTYRLVRRHPLVASLALIPAAWLSSMQWYSEPNMWTPATGRWVGISMILWIFALAYPVFRFCDWLDARHKKELQRLDRLQKLHAATR